MRRRFSSLVAARDAVGTYWGSALLIIAAGAIALAAVVPVVRLAESIGSPASRLNFSTVRVSTLGFHWGSNATTPADAQGETIALLFQLLLVASIATLVLAALSILSISAARASARLPEIAVRRAVGASRRNLLAAALAEGGVIGTGALLLGGVAGSVGLVAAQAGWPGKINPGSPGPGLLATLSIAVTIVLGALFQLLSTPSRRIAEPNPHPLELYIPALQLGMGLTILVASTMLVRHASGLVAERSGAAGNGLVFEISSPDSSPRNRALGYALLLDQLHREPGIQTASLMSPGALVGLGMADAITTDCGFCPDGGVVIRWHLVFTTHQFVTADTFGALGIETIEGRLLTDQDRWDSPPVAVISQSLARRHFQGGEALGRQVLLKLDKPDWYTVVGVVEDRQPEGFGGEAQPHSAIYLSALQHPPGTIDLLIRPAPGGFSTPAVRQAIGRNVATELAGEVSEPALVAREGRPLAWFGRWFTVLGWAMLLITAASTFVLMRLWVRSLRPELGLRRAVGARRGHLLLYILVRATLTALAGAAIAVWFGPALWDSLPEMIAGLPPWNFRLLAPLALLLVGIALAGAMLPALQASRDTPTGLIGSVGE
jgi:putative ABC transport system permease protein